MRPMRLGLAAAMIIALAAPIAVISAPKEKAAVSEAQRKQGMADTPALVQAAGLPCQVSDARFVGKSEDKKAKTETSYYEVACGGSMGFVIQNATGAAKPTAFTCVEANSEVDGKPPALPCILPANADPKAQLATALTKANISCVPEKARGVGQSATNTYLEVACQGGSGYILVASAPFDAAKAVEAQNCLNYDADDSGNVKCLLGDKAARIAVVDSIAKAANNGCAVKDRRFIGAAKDGANYFEASCQDGKGYIYRTAANGSLTQTFECAKAQSILGGCTLTDAREAETQQAALYTKLAKGAGSNCDVEKYAVFPTTGQDDVVELVCKDGSGAVGIFKAAGAKSEVIDCGRAPVAGYKCGLSKTVGNSSLTADLKKFDLKSCEVSNSRLMGKTAKGTTLLEVACSDGFKGYVIEYNASPVTAVGATSCTFAGGCKLPGNT